MELIQNVGYHVGTERLQILRRVATNQLLKIAFLQISFQGVDAWDAQHCGVEKAVDHIEGGNLWGSPLIGKGRQ